MGAYDYYYRQGLKVPDADVDRVTRAILEIKKELDRQGYDVNLRNGFIGDKADKAIKKFQKDKGLYVDGVVGPNTGKALFSVLFKSIGGGFAIPGDYICGMGRWESVYDPGCMVDHTAQKLGIDRGIMAWNSHFHPEITDDEAYDAETATTLAAKEMTAAYETYRQINQGRAWTAAILFHNNHVLAGAYAHGGWDEVLAESDPNKLANAQRYTSQVMAGC